MTKTRTLHARFDGDVLKPEEPVDLKQDVRYLITVEEEETAVHMGDAQNGLCMCFTALVDILGYSELINDCKGDYNSLNNTLMRLKETLVPYQLWLSDYNACDGSKVTVFSDSIFINVPLRHDFSTQSIDGRMEIIFTIEKIALYQLDLAIKGHFVRGCATINYSYFDDSIAFGPGLLEVAECEKKKAKCPRICLTNKIMGKIHDYNNNNNNNKEMVSAWKRLSNLICVDENGKYFINYLFRAFGVITIPRPPIKNVPNQPSINYLKAHKNQIEINLKKSYDKKITPKYIWLAEYHNFFCKEHFSDFSDFSDLLINDYDGNNHHFTKMNKTIRHQ